MKRFEISIFILSICVMLMNSCNRNVYPDDLTEEICLTEYEIFNPNIKYVSCESPISNKGYACTESGNKPFKCWFAAIKESDSYDYIVFFKNPFPLVGGNPWEIGIVKKKETETGYLIDSQISNIELCWCKFDDNQEYIGAKFDNKFLDNEQMCSVSAIIEITDNDAVEQITELIDSEYVFSYDDD